MADDVKLEQPFEPDLKLEIAHILLIDVVGFSRLLANDQVKIIKELNRIVRGRNASERPKMQGN